MYQVWEVADPRKEGFLTPELALCQYINITSCRKEEIIGKKKNKKVKSYLAAAVKAQREAGNAGSDKVTMTKLFCYGTLNVHAVQRAVWGEAMEGKCGHIYDYEMKMYKNNIFYLERKPGESVAGKVYELTAEQLKATDVFETNAYERVTIKGTATQDTVDTYVRNTKEVVA